jgi:Ribbon-helix-helix protein, copG family
MTPTSSTSPGTIIQSRVPAELATRLRAHAERQGRSVSKTIRLAVETALEASPTDHGEGADATTPPSRTVAGRVPAAASRMGDGEARRHSPGRSSPPLAAPEISTREKTT